MTREPGCLPAVDPLAFDYEDLRLRVDRGAFELFGPGSPESTFRVPLRWLGALVHDKKPDNQASCSSVSYAVRTPRSTGPTGPRYTTSPVFRVPSGDEPLFRASFTEVAALADRRVVRQGSGGGKRVTGIARHAASAPSGSAGSNSAAIAAADSARGTASSIRSPIAVRVTTSGGLISPVSVSTCSPVASNTTGKVVSRRAG